MRKTVEREKRKREPNPSKREWAFLVYIGGDNNLSEAGLEDIEELCYEGSSDKVYTGVEIDTYGELSGSIRYEITVPDWNGDAHRVVLERLEEKDHGHPSTLTDFLKWGFREFTADNHLVVVWNHGSGFRTIRRDIGFDDFGSSLDMPEIETAMVNAGVGPENKIRVIGFDACLMSMLEIANHFSDYVDYLVGSEETEPFDGWPYDAVLKSIKQSSDPRDLAKRIVDVYIESYRVQGMSEAYQPPVTQSAVDLAKTQAAVEALSALGEKLAADLPKHRTKLKNLRLRLQAFEMADYVDLIHMAELMAEEIPEVRAEARDLVKKAEECVVESKTLGESVKNARGLSIWYPASEYLYLYYRAKYLALKCNHNGSGWVNFLDGFFSE